MRPSLRRGTILAVIAVALVSNGNSGAASGTETEFPAIIAAGFEAYKSEGAQGALKAWLKGSALEGDKNAMAQIGALAQIETYYGKFGDAHFLARFDLSPTAQMIYAGLDYEKGPVFAKFLIFKIGNKAIVANLKFHTEPEQILPALLMSKTN